MKFNTEDLGNVVNHCNPFPLWENMLCFVKTHKRIVMDITKKYDEILQFAMNAEFNLANVFATYDTEARQQNDIKDLFVKQNKVLDEKKYKGRILRIVEPNELLSIYWIDLSDTCFLQSKSKIKTSLLYVFLLHFKNR